MAPDELFGGLSLFSDNSKPGDDGSSDLDLGGLDLEEAELEGGSPFDNLDTLGFADDDSDDFGDLGDLDLGAELLFTESDVSAVSFDYYNSVKSMQDKIQPPSAPTDENFTLSSSDFPYLDARYLSPLRLAILDQAKAQAELKENARMSPEDNAEEIFNNISSAIPFPIGANYPLFIEMCARKYENFLKLVTASAPQMSTKFEELLDRSKVDLAQYVFEVNGLLWHQISLYVGDERISRSVRVNYAVDGSMFYSVSAIGSAMEAYNEYLKSNGSKPAEIRTMTVGDLLDCVNYTLSYRNMSSTLHMSQDDVTTLSIGELLRRYTLLERDEDLLDLSTFTPENVFPQINSATTSMFERVSVKFSSVPREMLQQVSPLYLYLRAPFFREGGNKVHDYTDSITRELLYYIFVILELGIDDRKNQVRVSYEYLMLLTPFMISLMLNAPYVRPVIYFTPNPVSGSEGDFELNFYLHGKYYSVRENGLLINVVGDQRSAYLIPFVSIITQGARNVTCHDDGAETVRNSCPPCVVLPLHRLFADLQNAIKSAGAASKKMRIDGTTEYRYTPSLAWVVSRSYSSQQDIEDALDGEQRVSRTSNPLLNTLLTYSNKFEPERFPVNAGIADVGDGLTALYLEQSTGQLAGSSVRLISVMKGEQVLSDKGTLAFDETDGALIMRYFVKENGQEEGQTVVTEQGKFSLRLLGDGKSEDVEMPTVSEFVDIGSESARSYTSCAELRAINQRLCALNALDYEEELESVQLIIMRDLKNVTVNYHIDTLLARNLLLHYSTYAAAGEGMEHVNFESLKALIHIVLGPVPEIDDKAQWDEECRQVLERSIAESKMTVTDICIYLDQYDPNVMALQGLSNSETSNVVERTRYMAMHALPGVHRRLRDLEERMLLLRVLQEIGQDIAPILRKRNPLLTAYTSVTTADTLDDIEYTLKSGMKGGKKFDAFPLTRKVLHAEVGGSTPILKYFALERNVHGIMATAACSDDPQEQEIYQRFYEVLGLGAEGMPQILNMDERAFMRAPFAVPLETACSKNRGLLLRLIERGMLADTSARVNLYTIKAYDLLCVYGAELFGMRTPETAGKYAEDFDDVSVYLPYFYDYVGSFLVSYCFLQEEAVNSEATSADRVIAYRESPGGFMHDCDMSCFAGCDLVDLRTVISE